MDGALPRTHVGGYRQASQPASPMTSLAYTCSFHLSHTRRSPSMDSFRRPPSQPLPPPQTPASGLDISEMETGLLVHRPIERRIPDQETALLHPVPPDVSAIRNHVFSAEMPAVAGEDIVREHLREAAALRERAAALQAHIQRQAALIQRDMVQREQLHRLGLALSQDERARLAALTSILPRRVQHLETMRAAVHQCLAQARDHEAAVKRLYHAYPAAYPTHSW